MYSCTFSPRLTSQTTTLSSVGQTAYSVTCLLALLIRLLTNTIFAFKLQTTPKQADWTYLKYAFVRTMLFLGQLHVKWRSLFHVRTHIVSYPFVATPQTWKRLALKIMESRESFGFGTGNLTRWRLISTIWGNLIACVASVPVRGEENFGTGQGVFAFGPRGKWGEINHRQPRRCDLRTWQYCVTILAIQNKTSTD